jgi:D-alanyl-D-alanine carboxypeptidase/D-alanyl-D-alanine-endopeptidase (penicillin-binding protein 4)
MKKAPLVTWLTATILFSTPLLLAPGCGGSAGSTGQLPPGVQEIIDSPEFANSTWGIRVVDVENGEEIFGSLNPEIMLDPASTTKLFTVATGFDILGSDYSFETPVYRQGEVDTGRVLAGDLVLVAGGDLAMGGRGALEGTIEYTDYDHNDANALGMGVLTEGDPLAGLDELARQVAESGIAEVRGDVVIDDRLFGPGRSFNANEEYIITPIVINDNLIDLIIKPTQSGSPAELDWRPKSAAYHVENKVVTVDEGGQAEIAAESTAPGVITVEGEVPAGEDEMVRTYQVEDPASFARSLFIEALQRAGLRVESPVAGENDTGKLPAEENYAEEDRVALLVSPPFKEYGKLILKVSHNLGADSTLYWIAVHEGGSTMEDGLAIEHDFLAEMGVDTDGLIINDGQGALGSNFMSPFSVVQLLRYMSTREDFDDYRDCLPVLGVDGSLANTLPGSPAAGNVQAKTGTHGGGDTMNGRAVVFARALGGYMVTASGREIAFDINVNNVPIASIDEMRAIMDQHARIVEVIYEEY